MKILITGATGVMGLSTLEALKDSDVEIRAFCLDTPKELDKLKPYKNRIEIFKGDASNYNDIYNSLNGIDEVLHLASIIPPRSEEIPKIAFKVNYLSTKNIVDAIMQRNMQDTCKFVYISSVSVYGDRQAPIHWGRVGDPIHVSYEDYYGLSKIASERYLIESPLKYWAILRQTGIISPFMLSQRSSLIFHQPLNNALEYISNRDSARLMKGIVLRANDEFWNHIYNIGGGNGMRLPSFLLYKKAFGSLGFKNYMTMLDPKLFAIRNFHGMYYLDSDKLEKMFDYIQDDASYISECTKKYTKGFDALIRAIMNFSPIQAIAKSIFKNQFKTLSLSKGGPLKAIKDNAITDIQKFFIDKKHWENLPRFFTEPKIDYDKIIRLDHGYDDTKPESEIDINDIISAAKFRGGNCLSSTMAKGDMRTKLRFVCADGHEFDASPKLVLEGGHWCPYCEKNEWNPAHIARINPFFAQVWDPINDSNPDLIIKKIINPYQF